MLVMLLIEDVSTLLMMPKDCCWSAFHCCAVWVSRFTFTLPLLDCVPVVVVAVVFRLRLEGGCHDDKDVDRGRVHIVVDDKGMLPIRVPMLCCCL